ncbi:hypothetical protein [Alloscardovia criceti]|uniref:hypothetical protein n=1 Tax=Alloscardovia criceti TaxID=356828 RepID=UPI00036F5451|nr:hypothetical protein [Alloscardovia criceti]
MNAFVSKEKEVIDFYIATLRSHGFPEEAEEAEYAYYKAKNSNTGRIEWGYKGGHSNGYGWIADRPVFPPHWNAQDILNVRSRLFVIIQAMAAK